MQVKLTNLPFYGAIAATFACLKFWHATVNSSALSFLLTPVSTMIRVFTGQAPKVLPDHSYYFSSVNVLIDKSCSGFNFWMVSFMMVAFVMLNYAKRIQYKFLILPVAFGATYLWTILINTSRILASIIISRQFHDMALINEKVMHEAIGVFTNLSFLILSYLLIEKFFHKKYSNEKPA